MDLRPAEFGLVVLGGGGPLGLEASWNPRTSTDLSFLRYAISPSLTERMAGLPGPKRVFDDVDLFNVAIQIA